MSPRRVRASAIGVGVLTLMVVAAGGVAAGLVLSPDRQPPSLSHGQAAEDIAVTDQDFDDRRNVELALGVSAERDLMSSASGMVTKLLCEPGGTFTSGTASLWIDDAPVLSLATSRPLWRDMSFDTRGPDVEALQAELRRLGKDVPDHGYFNWVTWDAYRELVEANGGKTEYGVLSRSQVLWIPETEQVVQSCGAQVGSALGMDQPVATLPSALDSVQIKNVPSGAVPGERVLIVDGVNVPVDEEGRVADTDALAQLVATPSYQNYLNSDGETAMTGTYALTTPLEVVPVPPSAIYALQDRQGCVVGDGEGRAVTIAGSELGRSFITFDDGDTPSTIRTIPDSDEPCR